MRENKKQAALDYLKSIHVEYDSDPVIAYCAFIAGAEWADKTMIEKAIQWIESYLFDIGFPDDWCRDSATMKSGKQRFLEAMEE